MDFYSQSQWLLLFFLYSFLGWVWETCYVSLKNRQYTNRGFLHGPWLPIYGTGAVIILFLTLPVEDNWAGVFLLGMAGATLLEFFTGAAMERLFHVRYWDYSDKPLNVKGHICLPVSLAWGCFSLLLVFFLHPPVARLVQSVPLWAADGGSLALAVLFAVDATRSVQGALDLRALLESLSASSQHLAHLEEQLRLSAEHLTQSSEDLRRKLRQLEEAAAQNKEQLADAIAHRQESRKTYLLRTLDARRKRRSNFLSLLESKTRDALDALSAELTQRSDAAELAKLQALQELLGNAQTSIRKAQQDLAARRDRDYQRAVSILYRNPTAVSHRHAKAIQELQVLKKKRTHRK